MITATTIWEDVAQEWEKQGKPRIGGEPAAKVLRWRLLAPPHRIWWKALCNDVQPDELPLEIKSIRHLFSTHQAAMSDLHTRVAALVRGGRMDAVQLRELGNRQWGQHDDLAMGFLADMANEMAKELEQEPVYSRELIAETSFSVPIVFTSTALNNESSCGMVDMQFQWLSPGNGRLHPHPWMAYVDCDQEWNWGEKSVRQFLSKMDVWPEDSNFDVSWRISLPHPPGAAPLNIHGASATGLMGTAIWRMLAADPPGPLHVTKHLGD